MASYHFSLKCGNYNGRKTSAINHLNYINRDGKFKNIDKNNNEKQDRKSTRLNSSHITRSRMPSSA